MKCWICEEFEECPYAVCAEQEVADRLKEEEQQMDMFGESEE